MSLSATFFMHQNSNFALLWFFFCSSSLLFVNLIRRKWRKIFEKWGLLVVIMRADLIDQAQQTSSCIKSEQRTRVCLS